MTAPDDATPIWARPDAFPPKPHSSSDWGWFDNRGHSHSLRSREELIALIENEASDDVALVWSPDRQHVVIPEEIPELYQALSLARRRWNQSALQSSRRNLIRYTCLLLAFLAYEFWKTREFLPSHTGGIALLLYTMLALLPAYQAWKRSRELTRWNRQGMEHSIPSLRFETWLERQKSPHTWALIALISLVAATQVYVPFSSVQALGLAKSAYLQGQTWRLFTAPLLHGNVLHLACNLSALLYLGRRCEALMRWPHLPLVFVAAALFGGWASVHGNSQLSVGASGGLMGLLGCLLVFEWNHAALVPVAARRRLLSLVALTALSGVIGFQLIDNFAHAGGLVAGIVYAWLVFPKSTSARRPKILGSDRILGTLAWMSIALAGFLTIRLLLALAAHPA